MEVDDVAMAVNPVGTGGGLPALNVVAPEHEVNEELP